MGNLYTAIGQSTPVHVLLAYIGLCHHVMTIYQAKKQNAWLSCEPDQKINKERERGQHRNHEWRRPWPLPPPVGHLHLFRLMVHVDPFMGNVAHDRHHPNQAGGQAYTVQSTMAIWEGKHPHFGRRRLWPLPPPMGHPYLFHLIVRVDPVMGNTAYDRWHPNRGGPYSTINHAF